MKNLLFTLCFYLVSSTAFAKEVCKTDVGGQQVCTIYHNGDSDNPAAHQDQYDDYMKSAGKWDMISDSFIFLTFVGLGGNYYSLNKAQQYEQIKNQRPLTPNEQKQYDIWQSAENGSVAVTAGGLVFGLIGYRLQVHYENKAHRFALEVGTSW